jgi:hypothetical protein
MRKTPMAVAVNMPQNTTVPREWRALAPAPLAMTRGSTPRISTAVNSIRAKGKTRTPPRVCDVALVIETPPQIIEASRLELQKFAKKYHTGEKWELGTDLEFCPVNLE